MVPLPVIFLLATVLEISVLVLTSRAIGGLATLGLLVLGVVLGTWLLRREGRRTVREVTEAARLRRPPRRGIGDGVLIAASGILIIVPGFISDVVGLIGLLPPVRSLVRRRLRRAAERRSQSVQDEMRRYAYGFGPVDSGQPRGDFIDAEVVSVDEEDEDSANNRNSSARDGNSPGANDSADGSSSRSRELPPRRSARGDRRDD